MKSKIRNRISSGSVSNVDMLFDAVVEVQIMMEDRAGWPLT